MARIVNTGRVYKNDLGIVGGQNAKLTAAGGLRLGRDRRDLLAEQGVDERGFAHVGAPDDGHKAETKIKIHTMSLS